MLKWRLAEKLAVTDARHSLTCSCDPDNGSRHPGESFLQGRNLGCQGRKRLLWLRIKRRGPAMTTGSATSASASDYVFSGLVPGTQYWSRVRPVRGGQTEQWSDPATRVAPV